VKYNIIATSHTSHPEIQRRDMIFLGHAPKKPFRVLSEIQWNLFNSAAEFSHLLSCVKLMLFLIHLGSVLKESGTFSFQLMVFKGNYSHSLFMAPFRTPSGATVLPQAPTGP
jgi:hypothetical protein